MAKEIEMYNAYFGDCFILKDQGGNLLVDFGIHQKSRVSKNPYGGRGKLTTDIAAHIVKSYSNRGLNVLLTHFHEDHIGGLIYLLNNNISPLSNLVNKIYLPNIWNNPFIIATTLVEEMILFYQLKSTRLPRTSSSLLDLVQALSLVPRDIELLSRGVTFEDERYLALWPKREDDASDYETVLYGLGFPRDRMGELISLSERIGNHMFQLIEAEGDNGGNVRVINGFRNDYEQIYFRLFSEAAEGEQVRITEDNMVRLHKLNHKCNIVFHDTKSGDDNVLFTGDAEQEHLRYIFSPNDGLWLHEHYKFIKIPHHGTENHYWDFAPLTPEHILIPNGPVSIKQNPDAYKISAAYGSLTSKHTCSNSVFCKACNLACNAQTNCKGSVKDIVFPLLYKTVY